VASGRPGQVVHDTAGVRRLRSVQNRSSVVSNGEPVPVLDLSVEIEEHRDELLAAFAAVLKNGQFILGPAVAAFESEVAEYLGARHAVGVNSGTDALVLSLRAMGVGPGDEVITTPFTFFATAEAISILGATPVFVDVDPHTFNIDVDAVGASVTDRTKAVVPVHLFGQAAPMDDLGRIASRHGLLILEDVAQALGGADAGRKLGTIGDAGTLSFFPSKNLGGFGDGGMVVTADAGLAERVRVLRAHGGARKYHNEMLGYNSRLDELQAAMLRVKLPYLDAANAGRRRVADCYDALLAGVDGVVPPVRRTGVDHVFHQYTVRIAGGRRDAVAEALRADGIATMVYYPVPVHRLPVYGHLGVELPVSERLAAEVLSLPIWPRMEEAVVERVAGALAAALATS
jgi:dTDP-4-amino-4,6-dideoxygalactose transaminase